VPQVLLTQWQAGLRKVPLIKLLRSRMNLSLAAATEHVDELLEGRHLLMEIPTGRAAEELAAEVTELGVTARIVSGYAEKGVIYINPHLPKQSVGSSQDH